MKLMIGGNLFSVDTVITWKLQNEPGMSCLLFEFAMVSARSWFSRWSAVSHLTSKALIMLIPSESYFTSPKLLMTNICKPST